MQENIKFIVTEIKTNEEKQKLEEMGLYCYDLRDSDDAKDIASIEKRVIVNRIVEKNIQVNSIKELLDNKNRENDRGR